MKNKIKKAKIKGTASLSQATIEAEENQINKGEDSSLPLKPFYRNFRKMKTELPEIYHNMSITEKNQDSNDFLGKKMMTEEETNEVYESDFQQEIFSDFKEEVVE